MYNERRAGYLLKKGFFNSSIEMKNRLQLHSEKILQYKKTKLKNRNKKTEIQKNVCNLKKRKIGLPLFFSPPKEK